VSVIAALLWARVKNSAALKIPMTRTINAAMISIMLNALRETVVFMSQPP
jgi:hypothetical protein